MKRNFALLICLLTIISVLTISTAASEPEQIVISQTVDDLGNGCYCIETITVPSIQAFSNQKTGTKTSEYVSNNTTIFTISVTGIFTYDGTTSEATSASGKIAAYVDGVTLNSRKAYTSGSSAIVTASLTYDGSNLQKTVTLTCDKNGKLS